MPSNFHQRRRNRLSAANLFACQSSSPSPENRPKKYKFKHDLMYIRTYIDGLLGYDRLNTVASTDDCGTVGELLTALALIGFFHRNPLN